VKEYWEAQGFNSAADAEKPRKAKVNKPKPRIMVHKDSPTNDFRVIMMIAADSECSKGTKSSSIQLLTREQLKLFAGPGMCMESETQQANSGAIIFAMEIPLGDVLKADVKGVAAAIRKEIDFIHERRSRRVPVGTLSVSEKETAMECRIIITKKDPEDEAVKEYELEKGIELAKHLARELLGRWKARLVMKDLKCKRQANPADTCAEVPALYAMQLMLSTVDLRKDILSIDDYKQAYIQADKFEDDKEILIKFRDPEAMIEIIESGDLFKLRDVKVLG